MIQAIKDKLSCAVTDILMNWLINNLKNIFGINQFGTFYSFKDFKRIKDVPIICQFYNIAPSLQHYYISELVEYKFS